LEEDGLGLGCVNGSTQGREDSLLLCEWRGRPGPQKALQKHWSGLHFLSRLFRQHTLSAQLGNGSIYSLGPEKKNAILTNERRHSGTEGVLIYYTLHVSLAWGSLFLGVIALGISGHLRR